MQIKVKNADSCRIPSNMYKVKNGKLFLKTVKVNDKKLAYVGTICLCTILRFLAQICKNKFPFLQSPYESYVS